MNEEPKEYFFADTIQPGNKLTIPLIYRSLKLTNLCLKEIPSTNEISTVFATVEDKTIPIAYLSKKSPQCRLSLNLIPQNMSVELETTGNIAIDVVGYVHGVDVIGLMNLKKQLGLEDEPVSEKPSFQPFNVDNYQSLGDSIRYKDEIVGKGSIPMKGQKVSIKYSIELPNHTIISSTDPANKGKLPFKNIVRLAVAKLCPGVDKVLQTMREGGHRIAVIRPEIGFGEKGCKKANIPPHTTFCIHLHLVKCLSIVCYYKY